MCGNKRKQILNNSPKNKQLQMRNNSLSPWICHNLTDEDVNEY